MPRLLKYLLLLAVAGMAATSCINDDFSAPSAPDQLAFSTDTLAFDTVITAQGSPTKQFVVYNRGTGNVRIDSIRMAGAGGKRFFLNVDGQKGTIFRDVEIRAKDSIYVFVESLVDPTGQDEPLKITDRIDFMAGGMTRSVMVTAWAQDVVRMTADTIWTDTRFTAARPYLIYDTLLVAPGATLTVDPGATLLFHKGAAMRVYGTMKAVGTPDKHITLRGDRLDHVVGEIGFDIMAGQWGGVIMGYGSYDNEWAYVDMRGSELGLHVSSENPTKRTLHLFNCQLHNSSSSILTTYAAQVDAEGTEFSDCADGVVNLIGGRIHLVNCTLTNYYLFAISQEPILNLFLDEATHEQWPMRCYLDNCIIYGMPTDINVGILDDTDIYLRNCLMKSAGTDDSNFLNIVWAADPKFLVDREDYVFDYRLGDDSDAIGKGNRAYCPVTARYDRYGQDRFSGAGIDIGAYVWTPQGNNSYRVR